MEADALHIDSWKNVKNSFSNGHIAHAYLLEGSSTEEGFDFSVRMLNPIISLTISVVVANLFDPKNMSIHYG